MREIARWHAMGAPGNVGIHSMRSPYAIGLLMRFLSTTVFAALFLSTTLVHAEPEDSPDVFLEEEPITFGAMWPNPGMALSFTPEIWLEVGPVLLESAMLVEVDSGIVHPMLLLDPTNPEFGRPGSERLVAFQTTEPLPPSTAFDFVVANLNEAVEVATFTTSTEDVADPVVPLITPVFDFLVDSERITMLIDFVPDGGEDFDPNVLGALVMIEQEDAPFSAAGDFVFHRELFRPTTTALPLNTITGPGADFKVCLAVGAVGVNQVRIAPDVDNATCITHRVTEQEWDEMATEREQLREEEDDQPISPLLLLCADTRPASNSGSTAALLVVMGLAFAMRRKKRE